MHRGVHQGFSVTIGVRANPWGTIQHQLGPPIVAHEPLKGLFPGFASPFGEIQAKHWPMGVVLFESMRCEVDLPTEMEFFLRQPLNAFFYERRAPSLLRRLRLGMS